MRCRRQRDEPINDSPIGDALSPKHREKASDPRTMTGAGLCCRFEPDASRSEDGLCSGRVLREADAKARPTLGRVTDINAAAGALDE